MLLLHQTTNLLAAAAGIKFYTKAGYICEFISIDLHHLVAHHTHTHQETEEGWGHHSVEIPRIEAEVLHIEVEVPHIKVEVLRTEVEVLRTVVEVLRTKVEVLCTEVEVLRTEVEVLRTKVEVLLGHQFIQEAHHFLVAVALIAAGLGGGATERAFYVYMWPHIYIIVFIDLMIVKLLLLLLVYNVA